MDRMGAQSQVFIKIIDRVCRIEKSRMHLLHEQFPAADLYDKEFQIRDSQRR